MKNNDDRFLAIAACGALLLTAGIFVAVQWDAIIPEARSVAAPSAEDSSAVDRGSDLWAPESQAERIEVAPLRPTDSAAATVPAAGVVDSAVMTASVESDPMAWMAEPEAIARLVAAIDAVAGGEAPDLGKGVLPELREVLVRRNKDDRVVVAAGTHRRYTPAAEAIAAIDVNDLAMAYDSLAPVIDGAYNDQAADGIDFGARLVQAIDRLLAVPPPYVEPDMVSKGLYWGFADDDYEQLSIAQKHMLLMGLRNAEIVRAKLVEVRERLVGPDDGGPEATEPALPDGTLVAEDVPASPADVAVAEPFEPLN